MKDFEDVVQVGLGGRDAVEQVLPADMMSSSRLPDASCRGNAQTGATALVHETYLTLAKLDRIQWRSRSHCLGSVHLPIDDALVTAATRPEEPTQAGRGVGTARGVRPPAE